MFHAVTSGRAFSWKYRGFLVDYRFRFEFRHRLTELAAAISFLLLAMIFFAATAKAVEAAGRDDSLSALRDYVQLIDSGAKPARSPDQNSKNVDQNQSVDAAYAALRTFADRIGVDEPAPTADLPKLAEADNLLDFLRGLNCPAQSSAPSKEPAKGQRPGRGGDQTKHSRGRHLCRRKSLLDLPCEPGRIVQPHAHGQDRQDAEGQVRL